MTVRWLIDKITRHEGLNFFFTNRIPRRRATRFVGWLSKVEQPLVRDLSIGLWRLFTDLDLSDAKTTQFKSLHDCFTRELKEGARPIDVDPGVLVSPCDGIVVASGRIAGDALLQVKGSYYSLGELVGDRALTDELQYGTFVTLRLTSAMYHRFHAPHACQVEDVTYIPGDVWNVNPIALKRVPQLYCRNERAVLRARLAGSGDRIALVAVAAILVAGIRLRFLDLVRQTVTTRYPCAASLAKGEEMGWFEHGSTIIVLAPGHWQPCEGVHEGAMLRMGQALLRA